MRRILIAAAIILIGWFALKDWAYGFVVGTAETTPETPDYYYDEVWLERPGETPPGGWEEPWGVDLFVIPPPVSTPTRAGLIPASSDLLKSEFAKMLESSGLSDDSYMIYAPGLRSPSPASTGSMRAAEMETAKKDVAEAMKRYVSAENRLRGLIIVASPDSEPLVAAALQQLPEDETFRQRFGGILLPEGKNLSRWSEPAGACSPAFDGCAVKTTLNAESGMLSWIKPNLARSPRTYSVEEGFLATVDTRIETLSNWLELNADKPAEPFDTWAADEVVDVAPIRRPNAEEDISGERGN
ncbi:hypothetical protein [Henriciella sp.]|uniref:hypothetical protein n=1 Tax=Henriciella sp. TaxID=1968823 RepID=UPI00261284D7|nr:hypothetical protein [Henriciella sp.]